MLEHCSDPSTPHALHDLEDLYHVTMDDQPYPPYFDVEWTSTEEEAYPWLSRDGIIQDICTAMWHMFGVSLTTTDFVVADASGMDSKGEFKHRYHLIIRLAAELAIAPGKPQLAELLQVCLQPIYKVRDLETPTHGRHIIDPSVYRTKYDFRMIYQRKPGGEHPLLPITHLNAPMQTFLLDSLPSDVQHLQSRLPSGQPAPPLPAELVPRDPLHAIAGGGIGRKIIMRNTVCTNSGKRSTMQGDNNEVASKGSKGFSFLTPQGALWLAQQVLNKAGITDITPITLQGGNLHRVYCVTDKQSGRDCYGCPGKRHKSNNVICTLHMDGKMYYTCLAEGCGRQRKLVGLWATHLSDHATLAQRTPRLIHTGAVDMALRAMAEDPDLSVPDYAALKAVFELS
jgi:hypothetical protein